MRMRSIFYCFLICICAFAQGKEFKGESAGLVKRFQNPPEESKAFTWWHWMNDNVSEDGIVKDLEAMKYNGLGGFHLFSAAPLSTARGKVHYLSDEWWDAIELTARTADRLGLDFTFHNCAGFATSAGPWVKPEDAMKQVVWTQTYAKGKSPIKLERFTVENNKVSPMVYTVNNCQPEPHPKKAEWQNKYYKDIAVIAFPTPKDEQDGKPHLLKDWDIKANFGNGKAYYENHKRDLDKRVAPYPIAFSEIIDLTKKLSPDGTLDWTPPDARQWTILRFGYTITGMQNHPAPIGGRGLECDKFSREAVRAHFRDGVLPVIERANSGGKKRLDTILIDSYEAHEQNWTAAMPEEFKSRRGYDMVKYLPALTGRIIESSEFTERFLFDFRRTCADLIADYHYGEFRRLCHEHGLKLAVEGYGNTNAMDTLQCSMRGDLPMGEFWAGRTGGGSDLSIKLAQSAAEFMDESIVGVEAFTAARGQDTFEDSPASIKEQGDMFFTQGMNRVIFHTFAHQPFCDDLKPGMSMWLWGSQMHRNNTWWDESKAWLQYLSRVQTVLQEGKLVGDVALFYGEDAPVDTCADNYKARTKYAPKGGYNPAFKTEDKWLTPIPDGRDYYFVSAEVLSDFDFESGYITHKKSGSKCAILVMRDIEHISPALLERVASIVEKGGCIIMDRPARASGLTDYPASDARVRELASKMWAKVDKDGIASYGAGKIFPHSFGLENALNKIGFKKDFSGPEGGGIILRYTHRRTKDADIYFVTNIGTSKSEGEFTFRVSGKTPQIWNPMNGSISKNIVWEDSGNGLTKVRTKLEGGESRFFIFTNETSNLPRIVSLDSALSPIEGAKKFEVSARGKGSFTAKTADGKSLKLEAKKAPPPVLDLSKDWTLSFPVERGVRQNIKLKNLISWDKFDAFDEKHFSGTATYFKEFDIPEDMVQKGIGLELDLGEVAIIAHIWLNGEDIGTLWRPPFKADITKYAKAGKNKLLIRVTNTFTNRLVGDASLPDNCPDRDSKIPDWAYDPTLPRPETERKTFSSFDYIKKGRPTVKSGLLGDVKIKPFLILEVPKP